MKIECTTDEYRELTNIDRLERLKEYLEAAREDRDLLEKEVRDLQQKNSNLRIDTSLVAQLTKAMVKFYADRSNTNANKVREALNGLLPDQKILQIKTLREVSGCGLKEAKDFLEGSIYAFLPSPVEDDIPF